MSIRKRYLAFGITISVLVLVALLINRDKSLEDLKGAYTNEASEFITLEGMEVHYRDEGQGPAIVLLHGTAASLHTWNDWTRILKNQYRVIRLDLPAFGLTGPNDSGNYSMEYYTNFLNTFLRKLEADSFYLAGNSLGGQIAWNYALEYPDQVKKLVLLDASGLPSHKESAMVFRLARTPVLNNILKYVTPKSFIEKNLKEVYFNDSLVTDRLVTRYHDLTLREGNRQAFIDRAKTSFKNNSPQLKNLSVPTLIIWGKHDEWVPLENAHQFNDVIPNSEIVIIEKAGHVPMEERPKLSAEKTLQFLKD